MPALSEFGIYLMGLPFTRRRKSTPIDDARELSAHLSAYRDGRTPTANA